MAQLTVSFTTDPSATFYRIKYRRTGTSTYTTITATASPVVITNNIACGYAYEGTVQAVCSPGVSCYNFTISNPDMYQDGDVEYTNCSSGQTVTQAVTPGANFIVCSSTVPVIQNMNSATVTQGSVCGTATAEEASSEVPWAASAVECPVYYYQVTACDPAAPTPPNNEVRYDEALATGSTVVELTGAGYAGWYYLISDVGGPQTSTVLVATVYPNTNCNNMLP